MMFVTVEGGEGAGKTTQWANIADFLESKKILWIATREPGGTKIGEEIRKILKNKYNADLTPEAELLLFMADRIQHIKQVITPALNGGIVMLCDRYLDSSCAYQGAARKLKMENIRKLHQMFEVPIPDITFLLDLPAEVGLSRALKQINGGERDKTQTRFEDEKILFHRRLRQGYLQLAKNEPDRFCIIDAEQSGVRVWRDIKKVLDKFF